MSFGSEVAGGVVWRMKDEVDGIECRVIEL